MKSHKKSQNDVDIFQARNNWCTSFVLRKSKAKVLVRVVPCSGWEHAAIQTAAMLHICQNCTGVIYLFV